MSITEQTLEDLTERINIAAGESPQAWTKKEDGRYRATVGTYVLDYAYGGVALDRMDNESGGVRNVIGRGTTLETYRALESFLSKVISSRTPSGSLS